MNRPIALAIRDLETKINIAITDSQLPPCIVKAVLNGLYQQVIRAAQVEIAQAEQEYKEREGKADEQMDSSQG